MDADQKSLEPIVAHKLLTCYSCAQTKRADAFRYACCCESKRGVCKACERVPRSEWKEEMHDGGCLDKLHDFTAEYLAWNTELQRVAGRDYISMRMNEREECYTVAWMEGPNGERDDAWKAWLRDHKAEVKADWRKFRKQADISIPPPNPCTCCAV